MANSVAGGPAAGQLKRPYASKWGEPRLTEPPALSSHFLERTEAPSEQERWFAGKG